MKIRMEARISGEMREPRLWDHSLHSFLVDLRPDQMGDANVRSCEIWFLTWNIGHDALPPGIPLP
jgi:hypothetical protein